MVISLRSQPIITYYTKKDDSGEKHAFKHVQTCSAESRINVRKRLSCLTDYCVIIIINEQAGRN